MSKPKKSVSSSAPAPTQSKGARGDKAAPKRRINSCSKGKVGEREFAAILRDHGFEAERGQQHAGGADSPDVRGVPGVHFEVKRVQAGQPYNWLKQAHKDAAHGSMPVVAHRRNNQEWMAILSMADFLEMLKLKDLALAHALREPPLVVKGDADDISDML